MDFTADIQIFLLIFTRVASILWLLPLFSSRAVSVPFKAGLSLLIAYLFFDSMTVDRSFSSDPYFLLLFVMKEVFIGLAIGFSVKILFMAVNVAGEIISIQSGFAFARFMDPISMTQVTVIEQFKNLLAMMLFLAMDAHHILIKAMVSSFRDVPIGSVVIQQSFFQYLITATGRVFVTGFKIGAPIIVTLLFVEIALGMLSKMIPQINIFIEGVPLKILITVGMLSLSLSVMVPGIVNMFRGMDGEILRLFRLMV
jgi:flagellar biosynthetic protein FliR